MCVQRKFRSACAFAQSDQNPHWAHFGWILMQSFFMRTTKTLIRLGGCAGWSESPLGAHVRRYGFPCWKSFNIAWLCVLSVAYPCLSPKTPHRAYIAMLYKWIKCGIYPKYWAIIPPYHISSKSWPVHLDTCWMSDKKCKPWSHAALSGVWLGSTLFAQACLF